MVLVSTNSRGLYGKYGFVPLQKPETFMEISRTNPYATKSAA